jgi:hypothetical protein
MSVNHGPGRLAERDRGPSVAACCNTVHAQVLSSPRVSPRVAIAPPRLLLLSVSRSGYPRAVERTLAPRQRAAGWQQQAVVRHQQSRLPSGLGIISSLLYRVELFFVIIDQICADMNHWFGEATIEILTSFYVLVQRTISLDLMPTRLFGLLKFMMLISSILIVQCFHNNLRLIFCWIFYGLGPFIE